MMIPMNAPTPDGPHRPATGGNEVRRDWTGATGVYLLLGSALLGAAIGLGIDHWLGSRPIGLISSLVVFLAAGTWQMIKAAGR
jgi:F0F1-type ATP synthase assembly protein I